jgi:Lon protease-like protein
MTRPEEAADSQGRELTPNAAGAQRRGRSDPPALANVPVFPLPHVVLFPEALLPLHIFEPRYRKMLADCLAADGSIVIAHVDLRVGGRIAKVAGVGVIVEHQALPDGRSNIVVAGRGRVRLDEIVVEDPPQYPYKRARATCLSDVDVGVSDGDRAALVAAATMFATEVKKHDPSFTFRVPKELARHDAGGIADTCAFQLVVDAQVRQAILEELDPRTRVRMVMDQIALQHGAMLGDANGTVLN